MMKDFAKIALLLVLGPFLSAQSSIQVIQSPFAPSTEVGIQAAQAVAELRAESIASVKNYIHDAWQTLTRSMTDCRSLADPKLKQQPVLYVPADSQVPSPVQQLETTCNIRVQQLPKSIAHLGDLSPNEIQNQGLLYLPNPYVVPGGRFNEMYGWDSYFIIRGLLSDNQSDLARGMIENFFYEIEHYGALLNANRTYYFTRSQPPFLTSMIMGYYNYQKSNGHEDREWLQKAYSFAQRDHNLWTHEPHLAGNTGFARYFDVGDGPVPEMGDDPHYYAQVASYLLLNPDPNYRYLVARAKPSEPAAGPSFTFQLCGETKSAGTDVQPCADQQKLSLSADYFKGD